MKTFEYIAFNNVPIKLKDITNSYINSKTVKTAEKQLIKKYTYVYIIREIEC